MRVLILTGTYPCNEDPLPSIFTHNQVKALQKAGYDVSVLLTDVRSIRKKRPWGFSEYDFDGVHVYRYAIPCGPLPYLCGFAARRAALNGYKRVQKIIGTPDLIHAHFSGAGYCAAAIKEKYGVRYVVTEHGSNLLREPITKETNHFASIAYDNADRIIAVSSYLKNNMTRITDRSIVVFPNILPEQFRVIDCDKDKEFAFITVGSLQFGKRMDLTIDAFDEVHHLYPETQLLIVGDGPLKNELREMVKKKGLNDSVDFLGVIPNNKMPEIYNKCHCFVLPSEMETFGVVYAEAAACGLPVIATDCGGPRDIVNKDNGILIPKNDVKALEKAMIVMIQKINYDYKTISVEIKKKFGKNSFLKKIEYLYQSSGI